MRGPRMAGAIEAELALGDVRDVETSAEMHVEPWEIRAEYRRSVAAWSERYRRGCRESGIDYVPMHTETPFDVALLAYLEKRRRLG